MKQLAVRSAASLAAAFPLAAAAADPPGLAAPAPVIAAFRSACLGSFPDLDRAASLAAADRWVEEKRPVARKRSRATKIAPRLFERDGMTLVLAKPDPAVPGTTVACLVTGMASGTPQVQAFADAAAPALGLAAPTWSGKDAARTAFWTVPAGTVRASVARYRDTRSYSLQISQ